MNHLILASVSLLAIVATPAHALTTPTDDTPQNTAASSTVADDQSEDQQGLEDIIVTAQRTAESAQKTPIAIAVVKPEDLTRQNITRAEDLTRVVPALVATPSGGPNTSFFLRGVGNFSSNSYSDPAIAFSYDGIYIGRPNSTQGFFYDLERIEVLKGPQGTLYGRNATGGAINVLPRRPELGVNSGEVQASYGNYNAVQAQGAVNLALGDNAAFRLASTYNKHDGYLSDGTSDQNEVAVRAQVLVDLTPSLTTRIGADYSHQGGVGIGSSITGTFALVSPAAGYAFTPLTQFNPYIGIHDARADAYLQSRFVAQVGRNSEAIGTYPNQDNSVWGVTGETNWKTDAGTLTVVAGYRESDVNSLGTSSYFRAFIIDEYVNQVSLEARFAGKLGTVVDYLVGGYLFDESISNHSVINQFTTVPIQDYRTGTNSKAAFGKLGFHVTPTLTLTAAGRYTNDRKRFDGLSDVYGVFCGSPAPPQDFCPTAAFAPAVNTAAEVIAFYTARGVAFGPPGSRGPNRLTINNTQIAIDSVLTTRKFTYRLAADWQITPYNLIYASYETGFHGGGFNFARGLETYDPETIGAFTIGSKNRFFNNRLQFNVEAFYWKYRDQQISQFGADFSTPPISVFYTSNIGRSTIKGVDADAEFLLTPTTRLSGSVQYLDATYDSYTVFSGITTIPNFSCPFTTSTFRGAPAYRIDCSGRPGLFSPKWSFNVNAQQTIKLDRYKLVAQGGTRYRGDYYAATGYQTWQISRAAFQSDASLTLAPNSDAWFVTAYINNISDLRRISQSNVNNGINTQLAITSAPRTFGIRIGARFE